MISKEEIKTLNITLTFNLNSSERQQLVGFDTFALDDMKI
jgi:hypothetical protein